MAGPRGPHVNVHHIEQVFPRRIKKLADAVSSRIRKQCPDVRWKQSFSMLGGFDVIDIVESEDPEQVARAAMLIPGYGHAAN